MNLDRMFVVSSDVFEHYITRRDKLENYINNEGDIKTRTKLRGFIDVRECVYDNARFYLSGDPSVDKFLTILVEDFTAPKLTAKHWKDYSNL